MENIKFGSNEKDDYTVVFFELSSPITPKILPYINPPSVNSTKGVVLSGRGPIWLYCHLAHHYHPTKFIAVHDPRLGGAVVVESHSPNYQIGEIIKIGEP